MPLVTRMETLRPGSAEAREICSTLEHALMKAVTAGGARAADRAIAESESSRTPVDACRDVRHLERRP